jgi:hypothetical protein
MQSAKPSQYTDFCTVEPDPQDKNNDEKAREDDGHRSGEERNRGGMAMSVKNDDRLYLYHVPSLPFQIRLNDCVLGLVPQWATHSVEKGKTKACSKP